MCIIWIEEELGWYIQYGLPRSPVEEKKKTTKYSIYPLLGH